MKTQTLKFKIELYATFWSQKPLVDIKIDGVSKWKGELSGDVDTPTTIEFEHEFVDDTKSELVIHRTGKTKNQTIINEKGDILKDQLLHIKSIEIDEIDIGALVFEGIYRPEYPEPWASQQKKAGYQLDEELKNVTCLGHNGTWTFGFTSPFYMWLLENLY